MRRINPIIKRYLLTTVVGIIFCFVFLKCNKETEDTSKIENSNPVVMSDSIYNYSRNDNINYYTVLMLLVKCKEGYAEGEYRCVAGVRTRGWGITKGELETLNKKYHFKPPIKWTDIDNKEMADSVLRAVLEMRCSEIKKRYHFLDAPAVFALTSFVYNLGPGVLENATIKNGLAKYKKGNKLPLANAFLIYSKAKVRGRYVVLDGLRQRRELEKALLLHDFSPYKVEQLRKLVVIKVKNPIR